jgi:predicted DNA-binding transcriptional regulator AlpA
MKVMKLIPEKKFRFDTLGISATGFWRLKKAGDLPEPIVIGRRNYYTPESIMEWLASKKGKMGQELSD